MRYTISISIEAEHIPPDLLWSLAYDMAAQAESLDDGTYESERIPHTVVSVETTKD